MQLQQRINAFHKLGKFLGSDTAEIDKIVTTASFANGWFTEDNIRFSLHCWSDLLSDRNLENWLKNYDIAEENKKTIAIVMAGNIPLVGFHDFLSVLITGNKSLAKLSSNDSVLLPAIADKLCAFEPGFTDRIGFTEDRLTDFDAVIATGSNNTARYFEYYFGKYPNIIRKNRNAVAVLTGEESHEQLEGLAKDVFRYFGLGCRNVSKIFVPEDYNFDLLFNGMYSWKHVINNNKYMNNYDYNKAVYLMSNIQLLDNEFMLLKEDEATSSPISVLNYEYYKSLEDLKSRILKDRTELQAVVASCGIDDEIGFGKAQNPGLSDYADGIDTVAFLTGL